MPNHPREYHRPADLSAALELLRQPKTQSLALGPRVPLAPFANAEQVVDLSQLGLSYIKDDGGVLRIGAQTPLQELAESPLLRAFANGLVAEAAQLAAGLGLRHLAVVGGALNARSGPPEIRLVLMALKASLVVRTTGKLEQYEIGLASNWDHNWPNHIPIEIKLERRPAPYAGALVRIARSPKDDAILTAAATVQISQTPKGPTRETLVYLGPNPLCGTGATELPDQWGTQADVIQLALNNLEALGNTSSDFRAGAEYRVAMASVLTRRAITAAWKHAGLS